MICKNCGKKIEPSNSVFKDRKWRHSDDKMFVCFDKSDRPIRVGDQYLIAEPKDES